MVLILSYLYYKEYDLRTNDCWDEIFISPSNIIKPAYNKECNNSNFFVYDFNHNRHRSINLSIDHGIDILNSY